MPRALVGAIRNRKIRAAIFVVVAFFVLLNVIAFVHARAMTHFVDSGSRTVSPEQLSFIQKIRVLLTGVTVPRPMNLSDPSSINLAFTTHRFHSTDGIEIEAWFIPAGEKSSHTLIVQLHAYASSKSSCLAESRVLHDLGYDVMLIDFRSCGGSTGNYTTVGYREADDVTAAVRFAREHFKPKRLILLGTSMGAAAAIRAQSMNDHLADALIVEAPFDRLLSTVENRFHAMNLPSFPCARLIVFWGGFDQGYWGLAHNPADDACQIRCPVLHFHGTKDPRVTTLQAQNLFDHFAGPKRLIIFPHAGHAAYLNDDPTKWTSAVREFIAGV